MDQPSFHYRPFEADDVDAVHDLVAEVFGRFVAPLYVPEGVEAFLEFIHPHAILSHVQDGNFMMLAEAQNELVGVIEIWKNNHVALLFVREDYQRRGIAGELFRRALEKCRYSNPRLAAVTVNSSPNAREAYEALGFTATGEERTTDGIRYIPMTMVL